MVTWEILENPLQKKVILMQDQEGLCQGHCMTQDGHARFASAVLMGVVRWKQEADGRRGTSQD